MSSFLDLSTHVESKECIGDRVSTRRVRFKLEVLRRSAGIGFLSNDGYHTIHGMLDFLIDHELKYHGFRACKKLNFSYAYLNAHMHPHSFHKAL